MPSAGLPGLDETGDRGNDPKYTAGRRPTYPGGSRSARSRWLCALDRAVDREALGDVEVQYVWRFLRAHKIDLAARKSWCESNDPAFAAKAAAIVGLYMNPPENALVLAVDEKPSIQALERSPRLSRNSPMAGRLRANATITIGMGPPTLFAAFDMRQLAR